MEDVTGAAVQELAPTGPGDMVDQLNEASRQIRWSVITAILVFVAGLALMPWGLVVWALGVPAVWWLALNDHARRSVVVFYDVNDAQAVWFQQMVAACAQLASAQGSWRVVESGLTSNPYQRKINAGAGTVVNRLVSHANVNGPKLLITNIVVPTIECGKTSLHFLPDRVLVRDRKSFTDVAYEQLSCVSGSTNFIESSASVPRDAAQVGTTWQYVNKNGGPDRRFNNNRQLPIMRYGELELSTPAGFRWEMQSSLVNAPDTIERALSVKRQLAF
jgi:hypothetical protein